MLSLLSKIDQIIKTKTQLVIICLDKCINNKNKCILILNISIYALTNKMKFEMEKMHDDFFDAAA